jgi:glycosyltransferase involved in cell wall biosynthesis
MQKPKLFIWADSPTIQTGFGRVTKYLCDYLKDYFEIAVLGIGYYGNEKYDVSKYFIYPVDRGDTFGIDKFERVVKDFDPDLLLLFQDIFGMYHLNTKTKGFINNYKHVLYFPVDGKPFSYLWKEILEHATKVITYTKWARETIQETLPEIKDVDYLYHGIDTTAFYPLSSGNIKMLRRDFGWENKFVILNVNRFQPRKHVNQTIRIASMFIKGYKQCSCGNIYPKHLKRCDVNGCGPEAVKRIVDGHKDAALYLHMNLEEPMMGKLPSNYLTSFAVNNGFVPADNQKNIFFSGGQIYGEGTLTDAELNNIYNASNILLSTSYGEGFGLSTGEALATGTPVMVGRHSANFELTAEGKYGYLVPNSGVVNLGQDNGHVRPVMNEPLALYSLNEEYDKWVENNRKKVKYEEYAEYVKSTFNWDDVGKKICSILQEAINVAKV